MCINPADLFHTGISRCDILPCSRLQTHNKTLTTLHLQCCNCLSSLDGFYLSLSQMCSKKKKKKLLKLAFCIITPFLQLLPFLFHLFACKFFVKYAYPCKLVCTWSLFRCFNFTITKWTHFHKWCSSIMTNCSEKHVWSFSHSTWKHGHPFIVSSVYPSICPNGMLFLSLY